ncbi:MAG: hypothetical protein JJU06_08035 [Ectothiorhodospiraceae bacterium]|nr:hypothetical protein [Ectothiorhodospiraceae bacterium]MCH8505330.1 hypothetical protein [Ectothiorhodospiraceae bacterium]
MNKLSALALAGLIAAPGAFAADVQFGGDVDFDYYNVRGSENDRATGFEQRIRLATAIDAGNGVSVNARLNLFNDRWAGDNSGSAIDENPFTTRGNRTVQLDYGFVRFPLGPGALSVGRQISSWNHNMTASDDRRDRIGYATRVAGQTLSISYDRRQQIDDTDRATDGQQLNVAFLGPIGATGWNYGILFTQFEAGASGAGDTGVGYGLRGATLVSPYVSGVMGPVDMTVGMHYLGGSRGTVYTEDTFAGFIRAGFQATPDIRLEGQVFNQQGGALVAGGFDSFSSLIHNSPDHDVTATRIGGLNLGGQGTGDEDGPFGDQTDNSTTLVAIRAQLAISPVVTLTPAIGWVNYDRDHLDIDEDVTFVDLRADYQLNPATNLFAAIGYADSEDLLGNNTSGFVTGVNVQF